ncbi:hypothetical protein AA0472_1836 [Acetobacter estunensis NRIC 0472]|uniref:Uncharacterized protein n=1 Tax=Acetobacter estunensis TaxID=104097 RepID=A0A967B7A4_9PROT|nr:hypothetical protein [Acetobacter estunensis]NHO55197.1 hypothetical protein [Acetobacter estunensis]GBQ25666.1 hypothetical protein AA0472_1836 [Acetobacter estunensis NRIC 0472]
MSKRQDQQNYRITELERKVKGVQSQVTGLRTDSAALQKQAKDDAMRIRNLEIKVACQRGIPHKTVAEIHDISPARVSQIVKQTV